MLFQQLCGVPVTGFVGLYSVPALRSVGARQTRETKTMTKGVQLTHDRECDKGLVRWMQEQRS